MKNILFLLVTVFSTSEMLARETDIPSQAEIDQILDAEILADKGKPGGGVVVSIVRDGVLRERFLKGWGNVAEGVRLSENSVFFTASLAKAVTVELAMRLAKNKKLALTAPIVKYIPSFPDKTATIEDLINHTSGMYDVPFYPYCGESGGVHFVLKNLDRLPKEKVALQRDAFYYSNLGYGLLAHIIEITSGNSFDKLVMESLPSGPASAMAFNSPKVRKSPAYAIPYERNGDPVSEVPYCDQFRGFASMVASPKALEQWVIGLQSNPLWAAALLKESLTPNAALHYGWQIGQVDGRKVFRLSGQVAGLNHLVTWMPELKIWIIQLANVDNYNKNFTELFLLRYAGGLAVK